MSAPHLPALLAPEPSLATLKTRPWGGDRLAALKRAPTSIARPIGESWEFSTLADSESMVDGQRLCACLGRPLPFLAKLLDTAHELSIQVHPDDDPVTGALGKEEAWVVMGADRGARVLAGLRAGIDAATFTAAVRRAVADPAHGPGLVDLLESIPVQAGTIVLVPAGTVHAVGSGILLAELQQPVDLTLRLFDYGSGRELHVDAALQVARANARATVWQPGDAATRLTGKHLTLEVLPPGSHHRRATADELVMPFAGTVDVTTNGARHQLAAGELRLATRDLDYTITLAPGAGAVIGTIDVAAR